MRPIDADTLYSKLHSIGGCDAKDEFAKGYDDGVSAAIDCLQDAQTIYVSPVKDKENDRIKQLEKMVEDLRDELATCNWIIDRQCAEIEKLKKKKRGF
ncbi:MAG: hypothetical protein MJY71_08090 [Bacteroidaceae bacterium]|nr:hypothetical protein [Bacteroidaceae bacterium]